MKINRFIFCKCFTKRSSKCTLAFLYCCLLAEVGFDICGDSTGGPGDIRVDGVDWTVDTAGLIAGTLTTPPKKNLLYTWYE